MPALDVNHHPRSLEGTRLVYAVLSRRAGGVSIGVNLNPDGGCNFDCPYCQVDRSGPRPQDAPDLDVICDELTRILEEARSGRLWTRPSFAKVPAPGRHLVDVAFSGDGEPTASPLLPAAARAVRQVIERLAPGVPLRLITNATRLDVPSVRAALVAFDEVWCKLDAGDDQLFGLASASSLPLARVVDGILGLARERPVVLQTMLFTWEGAPPPAPSVDAYLRTLAALRDAGAGIARVQVYTVARRPSDPRVGPLPLPALEDVAARVRALGLEAAAFAGFAPAVVPATT